MKQFLKVSLFILLAQIFLCDASVSMDIYEGGEHQEITFSAHQKLFHAKLAKLKKKITKFPSIFISYSWDNEEHITLVKELSLDLKKVGFAIEYDKDTNRPGGECNINQHIDKISTSDKVILIGSSGLKDKYSKEQGIISQEINILRTRIKEEGSVGIIPLWFKGDIKDNFPKELRHLAARVLERGSLLDIGYFPHFFELLIDIFHTEKKGKSIVNHITEKKQEFIRQRDISSEVLEQYQTLQLKHLQDIADQDTKDILKILRPFTFDSLIPFYGEGSPSLIEWITRLRQVLSFHPSVLQDTQLSSSESSSEYPIILSSADVLYLSPEQHHFLFPNGKFQRMNSTGKRDVAVLEDQQQGIVFKRFPGIPGFEAAVGILSHLLFGHGTPYTVLARINNKPYLISQAMGRDTLSFNPQKPFARYKKLNLDYVLRHCPEKLDLIDHESLSQAIILSILTNPEDGQPANYVLEPILGLPDDEERYRIIAIDRDQSFVDEVTPAPSGIKAIFSAQPHVQVKTLLYCLDAMKDKTIHASVIQRLKQLDVKTLVNQWLQLLKTIHIADQKLFNTTERFNLWKNHQTYIGVPFRKGDVECLSTKLLMIQDFLYKNPHATHYQLLKNVQPWIALRYKPYLQKDFSSISTTASPALLRFLHADGPAYGLKIPKGKAPHISASLSSSYNILDPKDITVRKPTKEAIDAEEVFDPHAIMIELDAFIERYRKKGRDILLKDTNSTISRLMRGKTPADIILNLEDYPPHLQELLFDEIEKAKQIESLSLTHASLLRDDFFTSSLPWLGKLTKLDIRYCHQITEGFLPLLSKHASNLQELNLAGCKGIRLVIQSRFLQRPGSLTFSNLERLIVNDCLNLKHIRIHAPSLQGLWAKDCPNLQTFATLNLSMKDGNLKSVDIRNNPHVDEYRLGRFFEIHPNLTDVRVEGCNQIKLAKVKQIIDSYSFSTFRDLFTRYWKLRRDLESGKWSEDGLLSLDVYWANSSDISLLSVFSTLISLSINRIKITSKEVQTLSHLTNLISLDLARNRIDSAGMVYLKPLTNLTDLDLSSNNISDGKGLKSLAKVINLSSLDLSGNKISSKSIPYITSLPNLTDLDLSSNDIGYGKGLESLGQLTKLIKLRLGYNHLFNDQGVLLLAQLTNLTHLDLGSCGITSEGTRALSLHTNLQTLGLRNNRIGRNGGHHGLTALTNLTSLDLQGNELDDTMVRNLIILTKLTHLNLDFNLIVYTYSVQNSFSHVQSLRLSIYEEV